MKYNLTSADVTSDKETFHAEFDLTDSQISYTSGDALGIYPLNNPPEVAAILSALHVDEDLQVPVPQSCFSPRPEGDTMAMGKALSIYYDLKTIKLDLVKMMAESTSDTQQKQAGKKLLKDGVSRGAREGDIRYFRECGLEMVRVMLSPPLVGLQYNEYTTYLDTDTVLIATRSYICWPI